MVINYQKWKIIVPRRLYRLYLALYNISKQTTKDDKCDISPRASQSFEGEIGGYGADEVKSVMSLHESQTQTLSHNQTQTQSQTQSQSQDQITSIREWRKKKKRNRPYYGGGETTDTERYIFSEEERERDSDVDSNEMPIRGVSVGDVSDMGVGEVSGMGEMSTGTGDVNMSEFNTLLRTPIPIRPLYGTLSASSPLPLSDTRNDPPQEGGPLTSIDSDFVLISPTIDNPFDRYLDRFEAVAFSPNLYEN
jgi:hypothetical protein